MGEDLKITIWYSFIKNKQICSGGNIWVNWNFVRNLCDMCACYNLCMHALWSSECEALLELIWDEEKLYLVLFSKKKTYTYANLTLFSILNFVIISCFLIFLITVKPRGWEQVSRGIEHDLSIWIHLFSSSISSSVQGNNRYTILPLFLFFYEIGMKMFLEKILLLLLS